LYGSPATKEGSLSEVFLMMKQQTVSSKVLILTAALYFSSLLNMSFWRFVWQNVAIHNVWNLIFAVSLPFVIFLTLWAFFNLVIVKYIGKPVLAILLIFSAAANYAMFYFGIYIDSDMFRNVLETTWAEASDLLTFKSFSWIFLTGVVPAGMVIMRPVRYETFGRELVRRIFYIVLSVVILGVFFAAGYKEYVSFGRNYNQVRKLINTFNYLYAVGRYYQKEALKKYPFVIVDEYPQYMPPVGAPLKVVVLVLGETARAENFSLYGYGRETNPLLKKENVIVFKNVSACGTATAVSVPCMFSLLKRKNFDATQAKRTQNVLDIVKAAGYEVLWRENDGGCKGVCDRVQTENVCPDANKVPGHGGVCYDEVLLQGLNDKLKKLEHDTLIVLHMMGSHGPAYYERYPKKFKRFSPGCETADLQDCSREEIVNAYDNTIVYTDFVTAGLIDILKHFPQYQSAVIYVSDHGESLGENNFYLHGLPYRIAPAEQKNVPMIMWLSELFVRENNLNVKLIAQQAESSQFSHDQLFHSLLGMLNIHSKVYEAEQDILHPL